MMKEKDGDSPGLPVRAAKRPAVSSAAPYLFLAVFIPVAYLLLSDLALSQLGLQMQKIMLFCVGAAVAVGACLLWCGRLEEREAVAILLAIGLIMRVGVMLYTPYTVRQHDIGDIGTGGHIDYIYTLARTLRLPATNNQQFYQPPFYYAVAAVVYRLALLIRNTKDFAFNAVKLVPCFASCATMLVSVKIFRELKLSATALAIATAIVCLHPAFFYLAASINNDMLAILFLAIAVLYLIRWLKRQSFKNSILLALAIGFGMMTKMSVAIIAPVAAVVFAFVFFRRLKSHTGMELIPKFAAFLGICVPLGLWYPLRNWFLFRQSPGYVLLLSTDQPIYMGGHSIVQRFLSLPFATEMFARGRIFGDPARDYNIFMFLIKSSVLGEWDWSFEKLGTLAGQLVIANMLLIAVSLIAAAYVLIRARDKESRLKKALFALIWLSEMAFYVEFNLSYPFGCSMDFRYIVITVIVGAAFIGMAYDHVMHRHPRLPSAALVAMLCPLLLFTFSSVLFYTVI